MIAIAANNGDIGGGEVMQLAIARALRELGHEVLVVGPQAPSDLIDAARAEGFATHAVPGKGRKGYLAGLAAWRLRNRHLLLWCNGLVPALATAGMGERIVHLHKLPEGAQMAAARIAVRGARAVLVPSRYMQRNLPFKTVLLENWTDQIAVREEVPRGEELRIGFLGRTTRAKGVHLLARAVGNLHRQRPVRFVIGGESRFENEREKMIVEETLGHVASFTDRLGWVTREDFFNRIDLAVFPSLAPESFGLVVAEAMAAGVPFVVSDSGGLPEVAGEAYPWVFPRGEADALTRMLTAAAEADPAANVADCRRRWEENYSPAAGKDRLARLLERLEVTA
ncbi:glycosyltransferase family 4 protein [Dermabacteraceae bacterium P13088]